MNKGYADLHLHTTASDGTQEISDWLLCQSRHPGDKESVPIYGKGAQEANEEDD